MQPPAEQVALTGGCWPVIIGQAMGAVWISLTPLPIARMHTTGRQPPVKVGGWLRSIDSIHLRIKSFIRCPIAQNLTGKRICPKLNREDILCAVGIHTFALGQTTADQAIMIFNAAFSQEL